MKTAVAGKFGLLRGLWDLLAGTLAGPSRFLFFRRRTVRHTHLLVFCPVWFHSLKVTCFSCVDAKSLKESSQKSETGGE